MSAEKSAALKALSLQRKSDSRDPHCRLGDFYGGAYDHHEFVSPWTISAGNLDADLMIVLQDWSSKDTLESRGFDPEVAALGHTPSLPTNVRLKSLVKQHFGLAIEETFVTNMFVFIKRGPIHARIPVADARYSAQTYTLSEIRIVKPRTVICAGATTYNAIRSALGLAPNEPVAHRNLNPPRVDRSEIFWVPHPGGLGTAASGGAARVGDIWRSVASRHASAAPLSE